MRNALGLLCKKSCKKSDLLGLSAEEIIDYWNVALKAVQTALEYLKVNYGILGMRYFPYKDILPVIAVSINSEKFNEEISENKKKLDIWYWYAVFSGYFDNATETKSTKVIKELLGNEKEK